jgi:uncharacterized protein YbjT (DUF2867 family)
MQIKPIIFGATGMIGQGVLMECLDNPDVDSVLVVNRHPQNIHHKKVKEIIHSDFSDFSSLQNEFSNYDTCLFCLGVTAVGLSEQEYHKVIYDITVNAAEALLKTKKDFTFCYISGAGTDSSEKGRIMWARVKGKLENKLLSMPFKRAYMFRPGYIQPMKGIRSRTGWYNAVYAVFKPLYFVLKNFKGVVTDTSSLGKAMINAAASGYEKNIIEVKDINILAQSAS